MMTCRHCGSNHAHIFLDLGFAPPSNAYLTEKQLAQPETHFPLKTFICADCTLVQTVDFTEADQLFDKDYAYLSSASSSWLLHAKTYADMITERLGLTDRDFVIEIAANDGYLLKNFVAQNVPCLGIEPTASTAKYARNNDVPILERFFTTALAKQLVSENKQADLIIGNNVYAHVPDINDFTQGLKTALKPKGTINLEFPHLLNLVADNQFDTIYHEHFSYLSLTIVQRIFAQYGLKIYDVEELTTHGGSLRVYGCHHEHDVPISDAVAHLLQKEAEFGLGDLKTFEQMATRAQRVKDDLRHFLLNAKKDGKTVAGYGAAAKGNTLLNFAKIGPDLLPVIYDAASSKQGKFMPGSHIPILAPELLDGNPPDYLIIFPWNIAPEIMAQQRANGSKATFVTAIPELTFYK